MLSHALCWSVPSHYINTFEYQDWTTGKYLLVDVNKVLKVDYKNPTLASEHHLKVHSQVLTIVQWCTIR